MLAIFVFIQEAQSGFPPLKKEGQGGFKMPLKSPLSPLFQRGEPRLNLHIISCLSCFSWTNRCFQNHSLVFRRASASTSIYLNAELTIGCVFNPFTHV